MIALTGTVGYTITFSNMAVKASDSLEGVTGTNVMENMVGRKAIRRYRKRPSLEAKSFL